MLQAMSVMAVHPPGGGCCDILEPVGFGRDVRGCVVESGVSRIAASCGALLKVGRDSAPAVGETTLPGLAEPGGDVPWPVLKLGTRFLGTYEAE